MEDINTRMEDINAKLDQLDEKVNKRYAELKADIDKNRNELTGLKAGVEQGINTLQAKQKKTQESINTILARLPSHTSFPPPSYNLDPFNTPPPNTPKLPGQHDTTPPTKFSSLTFCRYQFPKHTDTK